MSLDFEIEDYSERSIVVRGKDTKTHSTELKELGGKWNPNLRNGGGWIFSKKKEEAVAQFQKTGKLTEKGVSIENWIKKVKKLPLERRTRVMEKCERIYEEEMKEM